MDELLNETILDIFYDHSYLKFYLKSNVTVVYELCGDCCAAPYIESFDNKDWLINEKVISTESYSSYPTSIEEIQVELDSESIDYHRYEISTRKGTASIEFRVSHNGYYGGDIKFVKIVDGKDF